MKKIVLILQLAISFGAMAQSQVYDLLQNKVWHGKYDEESTFVYSPTHIKHDFSEYDLGAKPYYLSADMVSPEDFDSTRVGNSTGGIYIVRPQVCFEIKEISSSKLIIRNTEQRHNIVLVTNHTLSSVLTNISMRNVADIGNGIASVDPLRTLVESMDYGTFAKLISNRPRINTGFIAAELYTRVGIIEEGDPYYEEVVNCTYYILDILEEHLLETYDEVIFEGCDSNSDCSNNCKGYIAAQPAHCSGTVWNTTTGYYDNLGHANGDCGEGSNVTLCGDGVTWACNPEECTAIAINTDGLSYTQCNTTNGAIWVPAKPTVLGTCQN